MSRARLQDRARLAPGSRTGRWWPGLAGLRVSTLGSAQECERRFLSFISLVGVAVGDGCGGVKVMDAGGGGPGGGVAVLLGKARDLVLPGGHGRVGGVVARVRRSVAVNIGRGENLFYLRTDRRWRSSFPS